MEPQEASGSLPSKVLEEVGGPAPQMPGTHPRQREPGGQWLRAGVCPACARNREEARGPGGGPVGRRFGRAEVGDEKEAGLSWALWIPAEIP